MADWTLSERSDAVFTLQTNLQAGVPYEKVLASLAKMQPRRAEFWEAALANIRSGHPLSDQLVGWPEAEVEAVRVGEHAGRLPEVFERIDEAIDTERTVRAQLGRLIQPGLVLVAGFGLGIFYMISVIPPLAKQSDATSAIGSLSLAMQGFFQAYGIYVGLGALGVATAVFHWLRDPRTRSMLLSAVLAVPKIGNIGRDLFFASWGQYMALLADAGVAGGGTGGGTPIDQMFRMTRRTLPVRFHASLEDVSRDLEVHGLAAALEARPDDITDRRREWPGPIYGAFENAENTGDLAVPLRRSSTQLQKIGLRELDKVMKVALFLALIVAGTTAMAPFVLYLIEVGQAAKSAL